MSSLIEIDGSKYEGGGAILRIACALSVITQKPCRVFNIRAGRPKPGLMPQHLLGIQALTQLCNGRLEGDFLGSEEIKFFPGEISRGPTSVNVRIETAGSITLVLQGLIPPALFASSPVKITFNGGATDTFFSPTFDYFQYVFLKILEKMGGKVEVNLLRRGYYPEGGARVEIKIYPISKALSHQGDDRNNREKGLKFLNLTERGKFKRILEISGASEFLKGKKVAERQIAGVREILGKLELPTQERIEYYQTQCPGSQICLVAEFENTIMGTDNLGRLGKRAEDVGKEAALELLKEQKSGACLDKHLSDQILPFIAMAKNRSTIRVSEITEHCKTNIWIIEKFLKGKFETEGNFVNWNPVD